MLVIPLLYSLSQIVQFSIAIPGLPCPFWLVSAVSTPAPEVVSSPGSFSDDTAAAAAAFFFFFFFFFLETLSSPLSCSATRSPSSGPFIGASRLGCHKYLTNQHHITLLKHIPSSQSFNTKTILKKSCLVSERKGLRRNSPTIYIISSSTSVSIHVPIYETMVYQTINIDYKLASYHSIRDSFFFSCLRVLGTFICDNARRTR